MENYHVTIIGSGPAAYSTAINLAEKGIRVLLLKQVKENSIKNNFGETLSQSVSSSLFDIGIQDSLQNLFMPKIENSVSSWGAERIENKSRLLHPSGFGWIFKRDEFEKLLYKKLNETKAKIISGDIISITKKSNNWITNVNISSKMVSIMSDFIIVAVGRGKLDSFQLPRKISVDKLVSCIVSFKDSNNDFDKSIYVDSSKNGWFYSIMNDKGNRIINYFTDGDLLGGKDEKQHIDFMKSEIGNLPSLSKIVTPQDLNKTHFYKVVSANTTFRTSLFREGLFVCGDAAQTYDPLSSQGITNAVEDGISLGNTISNYYNGYEMSFKEYETGRRNNFVEYLKTRHQIYSNEVRWKNNPFWERRHNIENIKSFLKKVESN